MPGREPTPGSRLRRRRTGPADRGAARREAQAEVAQLVHPADVEAERLRTESRALRAGTASLQRLASTHRDRTVALLTGQLRLVQPAPAAATRDGGPVTPPRDATP